MRVVRIILIVGIVPLLAFLTAWGTLALWYRLPPDGAARIAITAGFALFGLITTLSQFGANWRRRLVAFAVVFALLAAWWTTIKPPATGNWAPEVARQVTGTIDGDILTLTDMRAFDWRSPTEATETWTTRSFDLSRITSTGMVLSYWGNPDMAHFMLTFGFADGRYLTWSIEVRRQIGGKFSPVADFFKSNTLVIVAAEERDVIGLRTNIRGEDVQLYHLDIPAAIARKLIGDYVADANALTTRPAFFNSVTTNCTTAVYRMFRTNGGKFAFDWRMIVNGYLPEMIYDRGIADTSVALEELKARSRITARAQAAGLSDAYSTVIRQGVPGY
jgi:hypothetical protein